MAHDPSLLAGRRVWARRTGGARSLLVAIGATVFVLAFCLSATVGYVANSSLAGIRSVLATSDSSEVLRAPLSGNGTAQDAGVRAVIAKTFAGAPLTVTRAVSAGSEASVRWTITPNARLTTAADLPRLRVGYATLDAAVTKSRAARSSAAELSGHGAATILTMVRAVGALNAIEPIPITVLSLAGIVALLLARSLLTDYRRNETRFLRSRGGSGGAITVLDARESVVVCLAGTLLGCLAAQAALLAVVGPPTGVVEVIVPALAVLVVSLGINVLVSGLAARAASGVPRSESGRRRAAAPLTITGFGLAITVIALWRFEQAGSDGATFAADPSAVLAPGALLCAGTLLCLLGAGRVIAGIERGFRSGRSMSLFPIRSVNRHIAILVGPTALLAISLAIAAVTGSYTGTWTRFGADAGQLTTGGDLRASVSRAPLLSDASDLVPLSRFAAVSGVRAAALAARQSDTFGDVPVTVVAVTPTALSSVLSPESTVSEPRQIAGWLGSSSPVGLALPKGSSSISVTVSATGRATGNDTAVSTLLWLGDEHGDLFPLPLHTVRLGASGGMGTALSGPLPATGGPWVIEAVDAGISASGAVSGFSYRISAVGATVSGVAQAVDIPASPAWAPRNAVFDDGTSTTGESGTIGFNRSAISGDSIGNVSVRMMPAGSSTVPVVLGRAFARATGLVVGSKLAVDGQWASFEGVVTGIVAGVPGVSTGSSLIAGLPTLDRGWLATSEQIPTATEVWMSSGSPERTAVRIRTDLPVTDITTAASAGNTAIIRSATTALWIGAGGTSAFAIIALIAAAVALVRRRRTETFALRALGLRASTQAGLRQREFGILALIALVTGAIVGTGVSLLVTGTMARLSTPTAPTALPLELRFDPVLLGVILGVLAIAFLLCTIGYGLRIRRQAGGRS